MCPPELLDSTGSTTTCHFSKGRKAACCRPDDTQALSVLESDTLASLVRWVWVDEKVIILAPKRGCLIGKLHWKHIKIWSIAKIDQFSWHIGPRKSNPWNPLEYRWNWEPVACQTAGRLTTSLEQNWTKAWLVMICFQHSPRAPNNVFKWCIFRPKAQDSYCSWNPYELGRIRASTSQYWNTQPRSSKSPPDLLQPCQGWQIETRLRDAGGAPASSQSSLVFRWFLQIFPWVGCWWHLNMMIRPVFTGVLFNGQWTWWSTPRSSLPTINPISIWESIMIDYE